jgi:hypothetical protein
VSIDWVTVVLTGIVVDDEGAIVVEAGGSETVGPESLVVEPGEDEAVGSAALIGSMTPSGVVKASGDALPHAEASKIAARPIPM